MIILLAVSGIYDFRYRKIPNALIGIMGIYALLFSSMDAAERIAGFLIPALPLFFAALKMRNLNGGDIKYLAVKGLYFGITLMSVILFFDCIISCLWCCKTKEKSVPLASVTLISVIIVLCMWRKQI